MKTSRLLMLLTTVALVTACGPSREKMQSEIQEAESAMSALQYEIDSDAAMQLAARYTKYADCFPKDSLAPIYLMKCADLQAGIGQTNEAVATFDRIIDNYPDFEELPICYFFKGSTLERAGRMEEAVAVYEEYLELYPNHFMADDLRVLLPLVKQGMNEDEQLEYLLSHTTENMAQ